MPANYGESWADIQTSRTRAEPTFSHFGSSYGKLNFDTFEMNKMRDSSNDLHVELKISEEGERELKKALGSLLKDITAKYKDRTSDSLKSQVKIFPSHIEYKDVKTGLQIVATTDGLSYLVTPRGLIVQVTPNAIKVKDLDGQVKDMDMSGLKKGLKNLTDAVNEEVKDWISQNEYVAG